MFYRPSPRYAVEAVQNFGPNVDRFQMTMGERQCYIVKFHLAPYNNFTIESVAEALKEHPRGAELLVAGDLNINLSEPEGYWRNEDIAEALTTAGIKDMSAHFLPHQSP